MKSVVKKEEVMTWEAPAPSFRRMGIYFERDITPTTNITAGNVLLPPHQEQIKLSAHEGVEEIYYIVRGKGRFVLDDQEYEVEQGTAVYVAPGVRHRAINTEDSELELFWVNSPPAFGRVGGYADFITGWNRIR
jgi:mannose-6-phosphate isomerase-like protein (cupin superfamily)